MTIYHDPILLTGRDPDHHSGPGDADAYDAVHGVPTPAERAAEAEERASRRAHESTLVARMSWWELLDAYDDLDAITAACEAMHEGESLRRVLRVHRQLVAAAMAESDR